MNNQLLLNEAALKDQKEFLSKNKWVSIPNILSDESANSIYSALEKGTPWKLRMAKADQKDEYTIEQMKQFTPQQQQALALKYLDADFIYMHSRLDKEFIDIPDKASVLYGVSELFNSETFLTAMRELTGDDKINYVDCRATFFGNGHYLKKHDDFQMGSNRHYAYVLNMTRGWIPDWGGCLHLLDYSDNFIKTLAPQYNVLNIFRVPAPHFVSAVAPYAKAGRYGITGWFYVR